MTTLKDISDRELFAVLRTAFYECPHVDGKFDDWSSEDLSTHLSWARKALRYAVQRSQAHWDSVQEYRKEEKRARAAREVAEAQAAQQLAARAEACAAKRAANPKVLTWREIDHARELENGQQIWVAYNGHVYAARYRDDAQQSRAPGFDCETFSIHLPDELAQAWALRGTPTFTGIG